MATVYDAREVAVIVGGQQLTGIDIEAGITVARDEQSFNKELDINGVAYRTKNPNRSGSLVVNIKEGSPSNDILYRVLRDAERDDLAGFFDVEIKSVVTGRTFTASTGWVNGFPSVNYVGGTSAVLEWTIDLESLEFDFNATAGLEGDIAEFGQNFRDILQRAREELF